MRRFFLVSYDVVDDRRRDRLYKFLAGWGDRVQYSVFCCQLNRRELHRLRESMKSIVHQGKDQVLLIDAGIVKGERPLPLIDYIGKGWKPEPRSQIV
jgi:CRISPR-associated protein Cas2